MQDRKIDYDRGVMIKVHTSSGMDIFMYMDTPGVFYNAHGSEVSPTLAAQAGYDTVKLLKERNKRERMREAMEKIEAEVDAADKIEATVIVEREGFKVVDIGLGRHNLVDPDGEKLNTIPLPLEQATLLLDNIIPAKVEAVVEPEDKAQDPDEAKGTSDGTS